MARIAVGNRNTAERLIRNVVGGFAVGWRVGARVTGGTGIGNRLLRVVPFAGLPGAGAVAADAVGSGGNVVA